MTNYNRGAAFERKVMKDLEGKGYCVIRSAGSHSPVDVVACYWTLPGALFIQCKKDGRLDHGEWNELVDFARNGGAMPVLASDKRGGVNYYQITDYKSGIKGARAPKKELKL